MKRNKRYINIVGAILGAGIGYAYWYYLGCENGCTIKSVWWRMTAYGIVLGYLTTSIIVDLILPKSKESQNT